MSDERKEQPPDAVERIVRAIVNQALARCDRAGIAREDFYRVMLEEQQHHPRITLPELVKRVFSRLEESAN